MLENVPEMKGDPLWDLLHQFHADTRAHKIDLLVGVYRDDNGQTPVMQQVQKAELALANQALSKSYRMLSGNVKFNQQIAQFLLGDSPKIETQCTIQTVGGSGALRVLADFIARMSPTSVIWNTEPGYINHRPLMEGAGLTVKTFRWQNKQGALDIEACFEDLQDALEGDVILLHACCHNPTGIDPDLAQWQQFIDFCKLKKITPFIDMAYQGFGESPDDDAAGLRLFVEQMDEVLIATSCSKNMGLYCERTGAATIISHQTDKLADIRALLELITRANYSMPPDHGAAIASILLSNSVPWLDELSICRERVNSIRQTLASTLVSLNAPVAFQVFDKQKGMFSMLPLSASQMRMLREDFAIYGLPNGRINIAGLKQTQITTLTNALMSVLQHEDA